ncbi:fumarylacetoacetate hydrolase family protein [Actinoallomurus sp. CA-142502]|uniref:fumarylacetoacetate hydrolase family protein n=1 Tax=Actinoallomurus sp. CA-142502 TaxID=3239885 RepID=UPI003D91FC06
MKLATYRKDGQVRHGRIIDDTHVTDLGAGDVTPLLGRSDTDTDAPRYPLEDVTLLAPLLRPGKILAVAANYQDHVTETGGERIDKSRISPRLFLKPPTAISGPGEDIALPSVSDRIDWEVELVVVLGRGGKDIPVEEALAHVAGYTVGNDVSARAMDYGYERDTDDSAVGFFDWLNGKWLDGFAALGPWLLTADEVSDPQDLEISLEVNGEVMQHGSTGDMIFTVAEQIAFASRIMTLEPGDLIYTGTPSGVGLATNRFLKAGDRMTARLAGLGDLVNTVR